MCGAESPWGNISLHPDFVVPKVLIQGLVTQGWEYPSEMFS